MVNILDPKLIENFELEQARQALQEENSKLTTTEKVSEKPTLGARASQRLKDVKANSVEESNYVKRNL